VAEQNGSTREEAIAGTEAIYSLRTGGSTKLAPGRLRAGEAPQARPCCLLIFALRLSDDGLIPTPGLSTPDSENQFAHGCGSGGGGPPSGCGSATWRCSDERVPRVVQDYAQQRQNAQSTRSALSRVFSTGHVPPPRDVDRRRRAIDRCGLPACQPVAHQGDRDPAASRSSSRSSARSIARRLEW
jgi:hypothetical protein